MLSLDSFSLPAHVKSNARFLVAVSGGIDSMCLLDLMQKKKLDFCVAHVNFNLRPPDCDLDQKLVEDICQKNKIKLFTQSVNVATYKKTHNVSTQMAARDLRYHWFKQIMLKNKLDYLITAHHLNDNIETVFINLLRGTGINGITGMEVEQDSILRPLLTFTKEQIAAYARKENLVWREDKSNTENDYLRNNLRNNLFPSLQKIAPDYERQLGKSIDLITQDATLLNHFVEKEKEKLFIHESNFIKIEIHRLLKPSFNTAFIYHVFKDFGLKHPAEIVKLIHAKNGAEIVSDSHRVIVERGFLLIKPKETIVEKAITIPFEGKIKEPFQWSLKKTSHVDSKFIIKFDVYTLSFPLSLRRKKEGDFFYPTGMRGKKKISKFFKDLKLNKLEKENQWLLVDAQDNILWVVNQRQDRRFSGNKDTKTWLMIQDLN